MPISDKARTALRTMEDSGTTEGRAIAECLENILGNDGEDDPIDDEELTLSASELEGWAQFFIKAVRP